MIQGTSSGAGKTTLVAALCRIFSNKGYSVAPFKSQNMSNYSYKDGFEISQAQAIQAIAAQAEISPHMNPILLKPLGNYISNVVIQGKPYKKMSAKNYYEKFALKQGIKVAMESFDYLKSKYDVIILEGAGSPAEINLQKYDIANMKMAELAHSPVLLVADIEKGGSFASLAGTMSLLPKNHQNLVKGFVINKFRGNKALLQPGFRKLKQITSKSVFGVIPYVELDLPNEDSLDNKVHLFRKQNQKRLDSQIDKLASMVQKNLDIKSIEGMIQ
ncbi:MAG: cobyric acid synthase [Nitrososphaeria archaeon]|nr:cobyric acid synthase [Nitrosopumilaceae archaeon]NDB87909.1 cobyric acid synthase [Nitrososphaerota archaeon]NDB91817.1 cobyric acid synthase [Nitrososphaeria archaeon]NDB62657.1 cobyric acid synthase [Nitrosopumilaceae archaeon]NDB89944.1 cobyric acid synthase [Nitrososphaerota archaeon]